MWDYTKKVYEHFKNPKNVGEIENPDAVGEIGNLVCGDALRLTLKIEKETEKILDAKFKTFGCVSAIASSSALTELIKGKTLKEAVKTTNEEIAEYLGGLPPEKMHCSVMGMEALQAAEKDYRGIKVETPVNGIKEKIVCKCFNISESKILKAIEANNIKTVEEVTNYTKAGGGCGKCKGEIENIINGYWEKKEQKKFSSMTVVEKIKYIENVLSEKVNPKLKKDGGWVELVDLDGNNVKVRFMGVCSGCPSSGQTLKNVVEKELREKVDTNLNVQTG
jgi:NifU-like protein